MENGRKQEPRVAQDAEVDLLQRGKFKAGGKLLWPRKDNGTCGFGMCCFNKYAVCQKPNDVPSCKGQDIYYVDYNTKKTIEAWRGYQVADVIKGECLWLRDRYVPAYRFDSAIEYIRKYFHTPYEWLFKTALSDCETIGFGSLLDEQVSLVMCLARYCNGNHGNVFDEMLGHLRDNVCNFYCFGHSLFLLGERDALSWDEDTFHEDMSVFDLEASKCKDGSFEQEAFLFCKHVFEMLYYRTDEFFGRLFNLTILLADKYEPRLGGMSREGIELMFLDGCRHSLPIATPKARLLHKYHRG